MPNHVRHRMTIVGPDSDVRAFADKAHAPPPQPGLPPDGSRWREDEIKQRAAKGPPEPIALSFHAIVPLPDEYTTLDYTAYGYEAERLAWGTKWGPYDIADPIVGDGRVTYEFTCAWGLPDKFLETASRKFPTLTFFVSWGGEGPTRGRVVYRDGIVVQWTHRSYDEEEHEYPEYDEANEDAYFEASQAVERHYVTTHDAWVRGQVPS